jgi:multiple sugar transport system ATP-binding protein
MATVTLKNVYKIFPSDKDKDVIAVKDFNIEIQDREFVVFVGPSGCGKSTTLRMIAGLEEISKGEVIIDGKIVNDIPPKDRNIAMVFQNYALYPHMSVYQNMAFGLKLRKMPKAEIKQRVMDAADILGLDQLLQRKPKALSGGQRQRVALGRAIVRQPKVFLFDEPLSNLDAKMRVQMRAELVKLHQSLKATMIYVTHDQVEAMTMGTRIVVMDAVLNPKTGLKDGVVQQIDAPLTLYDKPENIFVAGFLGSPPMNFLHGTLLQTSGGCIFREKAPGTVELFLGDRKEATDYINKEVVLGIRPEHCSLAIDPVNEHKNTFEATVDLIEPMGAETYFYLNTGAGNLISRTHAALQGQAPGQKMRFLVDTNSLHLFDPNSTLRLK